MGEEKGPQFYDANLERHVRPLEESEWFDLYETAADLLPAPDGGRIVDLGCGTGRFARLLADRGYASYWGVDFSPARVRESRSYVPEFEFDVGDVFSDDVRRRFRDDDVFVMLEILEHVERDRELIASLPGGSRVIFSLPSYDAQAHVRHFGGLGEIMSRFGDLVGFEADREVVRDPKAERRVWVCSGIRT